MIARGLGAAINLKARIGGADEAAIRQRGTGEAVASPVPSAEPTTDGTLQPVDESTIVGYYTSAEVIPGTQTVLKKRKRLTIKSQAPKEKSCELVKKAKRV